MRGNRWSPPSGVDEKLGRLDEIRIVAKRGANGSACVFSNWLPKPLLRSVDDSVHFVFAETEPPESEDAAKPSVNVLEWRNGRFSWTARVSPMSRAIIGGSWLISTTKNQLLRAHLFVPGAVRPPSLIFELEESQTNDEARTVTSIWSDGWHCLVGTPTRWYWAAIDAETPIWQEIYAPSRRGWPRDIEYAWLSSWLVGIEMWNVGRRNIIFTKIQGNGQAPNAIETSWPYRQGEEEEWITALTSAGNRLWAAGLRRPTGLTGVWEIRGDASTVDVRMVASAADTGQDIVPIEQVITCLLPIPGGHGFIFSTPNGLGIVDLRRPWPVEIVVTEPMPRSALRIIGRTLIAIPHTPATMPTTAIIWDVDPWGMSIRKRAHVPIPSVPHKCNDVWVGA